MVGQTRRRGQSGIRRTAYGNAGSATRMHEPAGQTRAGWFSRASSLGMRLPKIGDVSGESAQRLQSKARMSDVRRGLIIVNTGPGKGKTTAAMGTALRAVGNGMKVLMLQFLKGSWHYGELDAVQAFGDRFVMKQMGRGFVKVGGAETDPEDIRMVEEAWAEAAQAIRSGLWDLVVLDEINYAISYG